MTVKSSSALSKVNTASIRFRLTASFLAIGIAFSLFMITIVPNRTTATANRVMQEDARFIVDLLSDNLALGMQTLELDNGASLDQTLALLKGNTISSVAVLDKKKQFVKGLHADKATLDKDTLISQRTNLRIYKTMRDGSGAVQGYVEVVLSKQNFLKQVNGFTFTIWIFALIIVCVIAVVGLYLSQSIIAPLANSTIMLKNISEGEGDLTQRLNVTARDEVGQQSMHFNAFVSKLQSVVHTIVENVSKLNTISAQLNTVALSASEIADTTKSKAENSAENVKNVASTLTIVAASATKVAGAVSAVAASIDQVNGLVSAIAQNCQKGFSISEKADATAQHTSEMMEKLRESASKVDAIVKVITNISGSTKLLSINASIEAATAGEAGKGFGVVATEVKALAHQTQQSTIQVREIAEQMQNNARAAAGALHEIQAAISEVNSINKMICTSVDEEASAMLTIATSISEANTLVSTIAGDVGESANRIASISSNIQDVHVASSKTQEGVQKNRENVSELSSVIDKLTQIAGRFKI